ncbi:calmodulin-binding receptor-like cytoplasmic kinase 2 isoform X2 [Elaeis guineensis]|uniref:non-specific serine/threonine protein kinase n=1 Tax=Elaeis guineensis var. tenera TaxID=51953 RepID=A0A6I9RV66_ELAGV|nr:calmodulin-binding receptor-like cytoplasmic kinase 2 isoform X2 [Elaeis guineensis]
MMRSPAPASGGRKSSASSRNPSTTSRNPSSTSRKSQDGWDSSRSSTSSVSSSGGSKSSSSSGRNPVKIAAWAFGSCFVPPVERSEKGDFSEGFKPPSLTPSPSAYGSSCGSSCGSSRGSSYAAEKRRSGRGIYNSNSGNTSQKEPGGTRFTMVEIRKATRNFSPALEIGRGGSGVVYKGQLNDGTLVANVHDNRPSMEFQSEIQTLARVEHLNLVRFYGYLEYEDEKIIVVEYVPNGTLREHLDCQHGKPLDLAARLDIAIDVAHALTYLHMYSDQPIIHRDIKSSNILITDNLRAKVADFGFARLGVAESGVSHVSTQVKGTAGYLDPEYLKTYQLTEKSDVFSFGVLLVELLSGRRPIEAQRDLKERVTAKWAIKKFTEENAIQILDPNLSPSPATNLAVEQILELVFQCLAPDRQRRPSMRRCAEILWSIRKDYRKLSSLDSFSQSSYQRNSSLIHNNKEKS